eukprot:3854487-Heterocapsa_arctica.AAC.1
MLFRLLRFCFSAPLIILLPPCDNAVPACSSVPSLHLWFAFSFSCACLSSSSAASSVVFFVFETPR